MLPPSGRVFEMKQKFIIGRVAFVAFFHLLLWNSSTWATVEGRYVRVEDPTGWMMVWRQIEILSGGTNIISGHPEMFTGTVWPDHNIKTRDGVEMTNGGKDTSVRGTYFPASPSQTEVNPWFEVDLGRLTSIDKVILYGAEYPHWQYLDHGTRVVTVLDENRRVVWCHKWNYYDTRDYPKGVFGFEPNEGDQNPLIGRVVPEGSGGWVPMGWLLDAEGIQPPPDAQERMLHFTQRNSPDEITRLANRFFAVLDDKVPELEEARQLHAAGRDAEAFESWKKYWFAKMRLLNSHRAVHTEYYSYGSQGEDLANGLMVTLSARSVRAVRYIPGEIKWIDLPDGSDDAAFNNALSDCEQKAQVGKVTRSLMDAYRRDPNPKYMIRWAEIMDDWALNFFEDAAKTPYEAENLFTFNPCNQWGVMMEDLSDAAVEHPEMINLIPAPTLARVQLLCLEKYSTAWWRQDRYTTFIHISTGICSWAIVLPYIAEFLPGQRAATEWRQSFERYMTMATEADGSPTDIGDEGHMEFAPQLGFPVAWLESAKEKPDWLTPGWLNRFYQWDDNSFKYFFRHTSPGGYDHRDSVAYRWERWTSTTAHYCSSGIYPWKQPFLNRDNAIFSIPEVRRILDALGHISSGVPAPLNPGAQRVADAQKACHDAVQKVLGGDKPGMPHVNSDWMPYTGSYYFRGGWDENAPFLSMLAPGSRGGSSSLYPGRSFYSTFYQYDYNFPLVLGEPVFVDGLPPQQLYGHFNTCRPGTKIDVLTYAEEKPAPFRWFSTNRFAFGEAIFQGAYQNRPSYLGPWDYRLQMEPGGPAVTGVKTSRQVLQLRNSRLFIVTDSSEPSDNAPHDFSIAYQLALSSKKEGGTKPFTTNQLEINDAGSLRAENPDGPSVSLYQFSDQQIHYRKGPEARLDFQAYAPRLGTDTGIAKQSVFSEFKNCSGLKLVSLMSSYDKGARDSIVGIEPLNRGDGSVGFHARLQNGDEIWYQSAGLQEGTLMCGLLRAVGQALLVVHGRDGFSGMLLGGKRLFLENRPVAISSGDFEFTVGDGKIWTTNIYTPIDPVSFQPNRNTFADSEMVTMTSNTQNVEIHYTTDGTVPTLGSPLYSGPVKITESAEFAARAYRLGPNGRPLPADDFEINGTKFTEPTYGWFYRKPYQSSAEVAEKELQPGLNYDYLQAPWWRLYSSEHWMPAEGGGTVERELDLSKASTSECYGMRYRGYIKIPEDGVYTFQAPREFIYMDNEPGYDLRVYVDGTEWYLTQWWHGYGTWSVPLRKGFHNFQVDFADARTTPWRKSGMWNYFPRAWVIHEGNPTNILLAGPGLTVGRIPQQWLYHKPEARTYADERVLIDSDDGLRCGEDGVVEVSLAGIDEICFKTRGESAKVFGRLVLNRTDGVRVSFAEAERELNPRRDAGALFLSLRGAFKSLSGTVDPALQSQATVIVQNPIAPASLGTGIASGAFPSGTERP